MNYYAVFDVGGSSIKFALMNDLGEFIEKSFAPTPEASLKLFVDTVESIVKDFQKQYELKGIAISVPGAVNVETGHIGGVTALPYIHGPSLKELLQDRTHIRVEIENDANCAGLAEGWIGAAKDIKDYLCIVIGTGIGGALVLDKKIRHGKNRFAGEFGYMIMEDYLEDSIGKTWSTLAATGGLINQVAIREGMEPNALTGEKVYEMAEGGNKEVRDEIEKFVKRLAVGIYNLQYVIDPEKILIGGAISSREGFIEQINETLNQMKHDKDSLTIQVERCQFGNDSNLIGALYHFIQRESMHGEKLGG